MLTQAHLEKMYIKMEREKYLIGLKWVQLSG